MNEVPQSTPALVPSTTPIPSGAANLLTVGVLLDLPGDERAHAVAARFLMGYSGHTRAAYRRDLTHYFAWCRDVDLPVLDASRAAVDAYARHLSENPHGRRQQPLSAATVARRLAALSGYYRYAVDEDVIARNPVASIRRPRVGHDSVTLGLDRDEALRLVAAARDTDPRAHALIVLLLHCGLRISEALGADVDDLTVIRGHRVLRITRKGGARRDVVLNAAAIDAVNTYIGDRTNGPLFATRKGGRYDRSAAFRQVRALAHQAGIPAADALSPHSLRHTFVTLSREAGVPLEDVQDAAGHADPRTSRRYDRGRHNLDRSPAHALGVFLSERD